MADDLPHMVCPACGGGAIPILYKAAPPEPELERIYGGSEYVRGGETTGGKNRRCLRCEHEWRGEPLPPDA